MAHRRKRGGHAEAPENHERWLVSYADFITLLMVFFVVLYSMSKADATKFQQISAALSQAFNVDVLRSGAAASIVSSPRIDPASTAVQDLFTEPNHAAEVARLKARLQSVIDADPTGQTPGVAVGADKEGVVIRLWGSFLFESGRAELKPNAVPLLDEIASEMRNLTNNVRVEGHTDNIPPDSTRYPTNWELSSARALTVTRYLAEVGGLRAGRLAAEGLGEYHPLYDNDTREHRSLNRRVEIHILADSQESQANVDAVTPQSGEAPAPASEPHPAPAPAGDAQPHSQPNAAEHHA